MSSSHSHSGVIGQHRSSIVQHAGSRHLCLAVALGTKRPVAVVATKGSSRIITATAFVGSGAQLTGVISGVELKSEGNSVGTAITAINFVGFNSVTAPVGGLSTATSWEVYDTWLYGGG